MAELGDLGHLADIPEQTSIEALPDGIFRLEIVASDCIVDREKFKGRRVTVEYSVLGPDGFEGRMGWDRFDIDRVFETKNGSVMIDALRFKALQHALGVDHHITNTDDLHHIPFLAKCSIQKNDNRYNSWNGYKPDGAAQSAPAPRPVATQSRPAPTTQAARPSTPVTSGRPAFLTRR